MVVSQVACAGIRARRKDNYKVEFLACRIRTTLDLGTPQGTMGESPTRQGEPPNNKLCTAPNVAKQPRYIVITFDHTVSTWCTIEVLTRAQSTTSSKASRNASPSTNSDHGCCPRRPAQRRIPGPLGVTVGSSNTACTHAPRNTEECAAGYQVSADRKNHRRNPMYWHHFCDFACLVYV